MKNWFKNNWFKLFILVVIIVIITGTFYWFECRPTQIKQRCYAEAEFDRRVVLEFNDTKRQEFMNAYYEDCLMRFGLK